MKDATPSEIAEFLIKERPRIHGPSGDLDWAIEPTVLRWLASNASSGMISLETGCGYSTVILASAGLQHTVISPIAAEHDAVRRLMEEMDIPTSSVEFICGKSDEVLPSIETEALDLALIDGWHGFPGPIVDWWYLAKRMPAGGRIVVDDVDIRAVRVLCDFLHAERRTWGLEEDFFKTKIFRMVTPEQIHVDWTQQKYCEKKLFRPQKELRRMAGAIYSKNLH